MQKRFFLGVLWLLTFLVLWAFWNALSAVGSQSTVQTNRALSLFVFTGLCYLGWLLLLARGMLEVVGRGRALAQSGKRNIVFVVAALACCFPLAFLFIGFILPPAIFLVSAVWLTYAVLLPSDDHDHLPSAP